MTTLLLLRHGQIGANHQGRWHGSTDSTLTWRGRRQVARTSKHLSRSYPAISAVYSSPLSRCQATADRIARKIDRELEVIDDLREYDIGEWEGKRFAELSREHDFVARATRNPDFAPPGGESMNAVAGRIVPVLQAIDARHDQGEQVLVVGHGAAFGVALATLLDGDPARWIDYPLANCGITELVLSPVPYVNLFNSTRHL